MSSKSLLDEFEVINWTNKSDKILTISLREPSLS
jgi:hypothetical protein